MVEMRNIYVYGDYGYASQCELEVFDSVDRARQWIDGYTKFGDMGGYDVIEVIHFTDDGELIVEYRIDAEDMELSHDWGDDNALIEEF
jgi:hypothetical protein